MRELFSIARVIATSDKPDVVDSMVKDLSTQELGRVWLIVNGFYLEALNARVIAEAREVDMMARVSNLNGVMSERLGETEGDNA